ncbi:hypothetical protein RND71_018897 [Anisodus tanguticus]|uniref:Uncharacterized protein n=1 Tax=Anisodus tanguticus TaxID=243964 RepID=A0AAE1VHA9_9SOLA|nr:hypothetical protein RND71_018897 [Anisodus tanguticus]
MTEAFKRLNQTKEELQKQNIHLLEKVTELELKLRQSSIRQTQSSPSSSKMDETGVHSLLNAKKPIIPGIGTTSPVQTVAGKDLPNPFMAVTLPKSEEEPSFSKTRRKLPQTLTGSSSKARSKRTKKQQTKNIEQIIKETLENIFKEQTEARQEETSSDNEFLESNYQDAQDPNADDDSGMSFDSVALHNLDT